MDDKLAADEARRSVQHEAVKSDIENQVDAEISAEASATRAQGETETVRNVATDFRAKAVDEVVQTEREVERAARLRAFHK